MKDQQLPEEVKQRIERRWVEVVEQTEHLPYNLPNYHTGLKEGALIMQEYAASIPTGALWEAVPVEKELPDVMPAPAVDSDGNFRYAYRSSLDGLWYDKDGNVRDIVSFLRPYTSPPSAFIPTDETSIQKLMREFGQELADKAAKAQQKYGYGADTWRDDKGWEQECNEGLQSHILKGDPRDVAVYCAFMWYHKWSTKPQPIPTDEALKEAMLKEVSALNDIDPVDGYDYNHALYDGVASACAAHAQSLVAPLEAEILRLKNIIAEGSGFIKQAEESTEAVVRALTESEKDEELEKLRDVLSEAAIQIRYLHQKFQETGSGNSVLARIAAALSPSTPAAGDAVEKP